MKSTNRADEETDEQSNNKLSSKIPTEWKRKARIGFKVVSAAADMLVHVRSNPGVVQFAAAGARVLDALDQVSNDGLPRDRFDSWCFGQDSVCCHTQVFNLCKNLGYVKPVETARENEQAYEGTLHGVKMGWVLASDIAMGPWIFEGDGEDGAAALRTLLWQEIGTSLVYCVNEKEGSFLAQDPLDQALSSQVAEDLWLRLEKFISKGTNRSVLLYGEPGTGKSHSIRHIAKRAGGLTLRLKAKDFPNTMGLSDVVGFLRPDAVLVDDLCKCLGNGLFTEVIDELRQSARLLLVTANDLTALDPALLRRFDDSFEVRGIDPHVFTEMTKGMSATVVERLRGLPTDWVSKYRELHDVLGPEKAESELDGILQRREQVLTRVEEQQV